MDPNTTYRHWLAGTKGESLVYARELLEWLQRGGFEPQWRQDARADFMRWAKAHGVRTREAA